MMTQRETEIVLKVRDILIGAGIDAASIKKEYHVALGGDRPFIAEIAIVDKDDSVKAVFEVKTVKASLDRIKAEVLGVARLFLSLGLNVPFYAVCNDEVAEIVDGEDPTWYKLEILATTIKERLFPKKNRSGIKSISEFLARISLAKQELENRVRADNTIPEEEKGTVKFFYRGQCDFNLPLEPSLFRKFSDIPILGLEEQSYYKEEQYLIQEASRIFPSAFSSCKTDVDKMAVAQHYGIPSRLLDVTGNALVALYFALLPRKNKAGENVKVDGCVYVFRASAYDYRLASTGGHSDKITIKGYHEGIITDLPKRPFLVMPSFRTKRHAAQDGAFYLVGNEMNPVRKHDFSPSKFVKIRIPNESKLKLLRQLEEECNIHRGTLFPESLADYSSKLTEDARRRIDVEALLELKK